MLNKAIKDFISGISLHQVWTHQAYHEISAKYKRTALGSLWIAGSMVATSLSLAIVFGGLFGQNLSEALPYVMSGILCFTVISFILVDSAEIYMTAGGIIKNHAYPYTYYIFEGVARTTITFFHNLIVFYIGIAIVGSFVLPHWSLLLALPIILASIFFWGNVVAMLAARFRDIRYLAPYVSQLLFFVTPIFWRADQLTGPRAYIAHYNPFYNMLEIIRSPLLGNVAPINYWVGSLLVLAAGIATWLFVFSSFRRRIPFWV